MFGHCFYFPVNIYSGKQRNRCNQTVPTKKSQDLSIPFLQFYSTNQKSAATWSMNNNIPVFIYLDQCYDGSNERRRFYDVVEE